jgi:hypothetical protein
MGNMPLTRDRKRERTYRGCFLLRLLGHDVNVPVLELYWYWRRGFRRYVCEDAIVVGAPAARTDTATGHALVRRLGKKCAEHPVEHRRLWRIRADDGRCGEEAVRVAVIIREGERGGRAWWRVVIVPLKIVRGRRR